MKTFNLTQGSQEESQERSQDRLRSPDLNQLVQDALAFPIDKDPVAAKQLIDSAMDALATACGAIQGQIDAANTRRWENGEFSDSDWYRRAHGALRAKKWQRQRLQDKIGLVNRQLRKQTTTNDEKTREQLFIEVAKEHLPHETFVHFWSLVDSAIAGRERAKQWIKENS
jgi:hypothetical protein